MERQALRNLVDKHQKGTALDRAFYTDADIYERELSEIYLKSWIYAGHVSEIPNIGDWFLFEMADESVIIARSKENEINAMLNVCRHRGSRVCLEERGDRKSVV